MDLIKKTNFDFVSQRNKFFMASLVINVVGLIAVFVLGMDLGIDFTGGTQVTVAFRKNTATADDVRGALAQLGFAGAELKSFGKPGQYLIRINKTGNATEVSAQIVASLQQKFQNDQVEMLGADNVEKKVSSELAWGAAKSLTVAFIVIVLYVAFRFEFVYGVATIVALLHDVLMAFVISALFNKTGLLNLEFSLNSLAAYLTILGYSINDSVVVFDRIRENREKHKGMPLAELVNLSINETLSRTLITGVSVLVALLTMVFIGGDVLEGFAFTMFIGVIIGTYSSVYIAASFVIWYQERVRHKRVGDVKHA